MNKYTAIKSIVFVITLLVVGLYVFGSSPEGSGLPEVHKETVVSGDNSFLDSSEITITRNPFIDVKVNSEKRMEVTSVQVKSSMPVPLVSASDDVEAGMKYVGYLSKNGIKSAFVLFGGKRYVVVEGGGLGDEYRILEISRKFIKVEKQPSRGIFLVYTGEVSRGEE